MVGMIWYVFPKVDDAIMGGTFSRIYKVGFILLYKTEEYNRIVKYDWENQIIIRQLILLCNALTKMVILLIYRPEEVVVSYFSSDHAVVVNISKIKKRTRAGALVRFFMTISI
jgi:hypothetical protein